MMSIQFYDQNASSFFADTVHVDMMDLYAQFLAHVRAGGNILDAGCGSGRDSLAFLRRGYQVDAFDGSKEMVQRANALTGLPVAHLLFEDFEQQWKNVQYDGIWCCASLLHVGRQNLPGVLTGLFHRLHPDGVVYLSFKYGTHDRLKDGRHFTDLDEATLTALLSAAGGRLIEAPWITSDNRPGRSDQWLNALVGRST